MDDLFGSPQGASDPTSDFLERERQALGTDATSFQSSASADYDFEGGASAFPDLEGETSAGLGGLGSPAAGGGGSDEYGFDSMGGGQETRSVQNGNGHNAGPPTPSFQAPTTFTPAPTTPATDSEFISSWKVKQAEEISRREEESAKRKEETIVKAQNAIDNFYKDYNSKKEKNIARNKEEETKFNEARTDELAKGTTWERICSMVELQDSRSKTTSRSKQDLSRFKDVLLALKREGESAPGAGGY